MLAALPKYKKLVALPSDAPVPVCCKVKKNLAKFKQPPNVIEQPILIDGWQHKNCLQFDFNKAHTTDFHENKSFY